MTDLSVQAIEVLRLLRDNHLVLLAGPPAVGKSHLISQIRKGFEYAAGVGYDPDGAVPYPEQGVDAVDTWQPSPGRTPRKVFETVFHPHSKHRDFVRGITPRLDGNSGFRVVDGHLYKASEFAKDGGAALLVIDEINRGPAVQLFGESIAAIEGDKRLAPNDDVLDTSKPFPMLTDDGDHEDYFLSDHLYMVGAMNQADTSVEPLDVAFLRRWERYELHPDRRMLARHLALDPNTLDDPLPDEPEEPGDLYRCAVRAWEAINRRISLGRGEDYQLGHGVFMDGEPPTEYLDDAGQYIDLRWGRIRTHIDEVFFNDKRSIAAVLNVDSYAGEHPYQFTESSFAGEPVASLSTPSISGAGDLYQVLIAIADDA